MHNDLTSKQEPVRRGDIRPANAGRTNGGHSSRWEGFEPLEARRLFSSYIVTNLSDLAGNVNSVAADINASGQVVGTRAPGMQANFPNDPIPERAVLWNNGVMVDLGTLGGRHSGANGINDHGQVVGWASTAMDAIHAFLITPQDENGDGKPDLWFRDDDGDGANDLMRDLDGGGGYSRAWGLNNAGQVVGDFNTYRAFIWQHGTMTDLGTLGGPNTRAYAINDAGQVVGTSGRAFLWQNGVMTDLGLNPLNHVSDAVDINASGQVAGAWGLWTPATPNGTTGTVTPLPALPDQGSVPARSAALGLNDAGLVVGGSVWSYNGGGEGEGGGDALLVATLWAGGDPQALDDPSGNINYATDINEAGQIIANGFLLTPVSEDDRAVVVDRRIFYNRSIYDDVDSSANAADDGAIAPGKAALLPGQSPSFANVSSYDKGINGVIVDLAGLPRDSTLTAGDFEIGGSGTPPASVSVRRGAGVEGSDRVTLTWSDYTAPAGAAHRAVANGWLRVTVKANASTGLSQPDVFSFGNLIGETGDGTGASGWRVSSSDVSSVRRALNSRTSIASATDFNRDGRINARDLATVRWAVNQALPPAGAPAVFIDGAALGNAVGPGLVSSRGVPRRRLALLAALSLVGVGASPNGSSFGATAPALPSAQL